MTDTLAALRQLVAQWREEAKDMRRQAETAAAVRTADTTTQQGLLLESAGTCDANADELAAALDRLEAQTTSSQPFDPHNNAVPSKQDGSVGAVVAFICGCGDHTRNVQVRCDTCQMLDRANLEAEIIAHAAAHWFTQGGAREFGALPRVHNPDGLIAAILDRVRRPSQQTDQETRG